MVKAGSNDVIPLNAIEGVCYPIPMDDRNKEVALIEVLHSDLAAVKDPHWRSYVSDHHDYS